MTDYIEHYIIPPTRMPPNSPITSHISIDKDPDELDNADYRFESSRLQSFKDWLCSWIKPEKLAAAGFYYTCESDKVRCFECHIEICEWQADDNPMTDHQRWSRSCRFICNIPCGNVPIGADPSTIPAFVPKGMDVCGPYDSIYMPYSGPNDEAIEERVDFKLRQKSASSPKHPEYASYAVRIASFDKWPKALPQTKESLATAGFYYTGSGDQTVCYYCGGGLRDWERDDDPWIEHAKWFDYCPYLLLTKGTAFVSNITGKTYLGENLPSGINKLEEKMEKDSNNESNSSGSSQNSLNSEEMSTTVNAVSGEASSEKQSGQDDKDARLCKICYSREVRMVFMPCGHLLACTECARNMKICGVCRKPVNETLRVHLS